MPQLQQRFTLAAALVQKLGARDAKSLGNFFQHNDRWISNAALYPADVRSMKAAIESQRFLGNVQVRPIFLNIQTDSPPDIHRRRAAICRLLIYRL